MHIPTEFKSPGLEGGHTERIAKWLLVVKGSGIVGQQLRSVLQPIVDGITGRVIAHEALLRGPSDAGTPAALFSAADRLGQRSTLESNARMAALERLPDLPPEQRLFVNIDTTDPEIPIAPTSLDVDPGRVVLELSEETAVAGNVSLSRQLRRWREAGFHIALDNYGAGHMGLGAVLAARPQIIKLNRSIIQNLFADPARQAIVEAAVTLSRRLDITVIALGVETGDEFWAVRDAGIRFVQGFLLAYPGPDPLMRVNLPLRRQSQSLARGN